MCLVMLATQQLRHIPAFGARPFFSCPLRRQLLAALLGGQHFGEVHNVVRQRAPQRYATYLFQSTNRECAQPTKSL